MPVADITDVEVIDRVQIPVIRITNPFNPREFVREELRWAPAKTLLDYFPFPCVEAIVSINGKIIPEEQFATTYLDRTDNLVICPIPTGSGGGKSILRMVAMIAIMVVAPEIGAFLGPSATLGVSGVFGLSAAAWTVGVTMAGSMLVNALLAPPTPTRDTGSTTSSYGIDGAKNTSIEGICVPVCYGEFRMGGNVLGMYVDNTSDDTQILYMLLSAGEGRVIALSDVLINDNPLADYKDVEVQTRLGLPNQLPVPWFNDTVRADNVGQKLTESWFYHTTRDSVDKIRLDFVAPQGLYELDKNSGESKTVDVDLDMEYRAVGSNAWLKMPTQSEIMSWRDAYATYEGPPGAYNVSYDIGTKVGSYSMNPGGPMIYVTDPALVWRDANGTLITDPEQLTYLETAPTTTPNEPYTGGAGL